MTPKYSLANLLLFTAFIGAAALAYSYHSKLKSAVARADALEAELNNSRPIAFGDVIWQIRNATKHIAKTSVNGVHYNSLRDRYHVQFGWIDPTTNQELGTGITFEPNGDGSYTGWILSPPFATEELTDKGDTRTTPFYVTIKDTVRLSNDLRAKHGSDSIKNSKEPLKY